MLERVGDGALRGQGRWRGAHDRRRACSLVAPWSSSRTVDDHGGDQDRRSQDQVREIAARPIGVRGACVGGAVRFRRVRLRLLDPRAIRPAGFLTPLPCAFPRRLAPLLLLPCPSTSPLVVVSLARPGVPEDSEGCIEPLHSRVVCAHAIRVRVVLAGQSSKCSLYDLRLRLRAHLKRLVEVLFFFVIHSVDTALASASLLWKTEGCASPTQAG